MRFKTKKRKQEKTREGKEEGEKEKKRNKTKQKKNARLLHILDKISKLHLCVLVTVRIFH